MPFAEITGVGMTVPERVVANDELAATIGVDDEWVVRRTGIRARHIAGPDERTSTLATLAARRALDDAGVSPEAVDLIVVATCTPDSAIPATAPMVQAALGARSAGAFDVNAACAGFLTAFDVCSALIRAGTVVRAVVVGAEVLSRVVDWSDPKICVLFGDGAGAVVLEASERKAGLLASVFGADGSGANLIRIPEGERFLRMNGPEVFRAAVRVMTDAARDALRAAGVSAGEIDLLIAHQANQRIIAEVGERLGVSPDGVFTNVERYGNTSAASIPIALCEAVGAGRLRDGSRLLLTAVGAGLTWGAGVIEWTASRARRTEPDQITREMELAYGG
jgi:3-oxoacyl-[acyl-carrier-protein] synthase-3